AQQDEGEHRVTGGGRVVVERLLPCDELLAVGRREEEAAALRVAEELDRAQSQPPRLSQPAQLARRDVQLVQAMRDVGVVVEVGGVLRAAASQRSPERLDREHGSKLARNFEKIGAIEATRSPRKRR